MQSISKRKFNEYCLLAIGVLLCIYLNFFFEPIGNFNSMLSIIVLLLINVFAMLLIPIISRKYKAWIHSVTIVFIPTLMYLFLTGYNEVLEKLISVSLYVVFFSLTLLIAICTFIIDFNRTRFRRIISVFVGLILCTTSICTPIGVIAQRQNKARNQEQMVNNSIESLTIADCQEDLEDINNWEELSLDRRLEILQIIVNIEASNLGLYERPKVFTEPQGKHVNGSYIRSDNSICVSLEKLTENKECDLIHTMCHECYHAWEHQIVNIYDNCKDESIKNCYPYNKAEEYKFEFNNYISSEESFIGYSAQKIEIDAEDYGKLRELKYLKVIE